MSNDQCTSGTFGHSARGTYLLDGKRYTARSPNHAIRRGVALVAEDRKTQSLVLANTVRFTGLSVDAVIPMASTIPASYLGTTTSGTVIAEWETRVREITERLVSTLETAGSAPTDLIASVASPLPTAVIAEMMAIPPRRQDDFKR